MAERVHSYDLGVTWEPNVPQAILLADDLGRAALALNPHPNDDDKRCVVLVWSGTAYACLAGPNDEAVSGRRLYAMGLRDVLWAGLVDDSTLIGSLERQSRVRPDHDAARLERLRHYIVLQKERVAEIVAEAAIVQRHGGTTVEAAVSALRD